MTLNDPESCVREWLEQIYRLAGPGADRAKMAMDLLDEQEALLEEKSEQIDALIEDFGEIDEIRRDMGDYRLVQELALAADLVEDGEYVPLEPILRMFLPID